MKKIFAVLMLVAVAKGSSAWEDYRTRQWNRGFQPQTQWYSPSGYSPSLSGPGFGSPGQGFLPPGHSHTPPGHSHIPPGHQQIPPGHMYSPTCQVLDQLVKLQANQPSNSLDKSCNVGWICLDPKTEDMTITTIDGTQIIIAKQQPSNNWPNQIVVDNNNNNNGNNNGNVMNDGPTQGNPNNANLPVESSTPAAINPITSQANDESSRREGGEGLIDVRIGDK